MGRAHGASAALLFSLGVASALLPVAGCKRAPPAPDAGSEPASSIPYSPDDLVVGTPGHQVSLGPSLPLPPGWPADVPLYPNAHVSSVQVGDASDGTTLLFETRDSPAAVEAFYRARLGGMPVQLDIGMGAPLPARTLIVKSPTHTVSLFVTRVAGDTRVTLSVVPS